MLRLYPRMMHPHRRDELSLRCLLDDRLEEALTDLFGEESLAAQSMMYFKPDGAKGQAPHQDNFFLKVEPGPGADGCRRDGRRECYGTTGQGLERNVL